MGCMQINIFDVPTIIKVSFTERKTREAFYFQWTKKPFNIENCRKKAKK